MPPKWSWCKYFGFGALRHPRCSVSSPHQHCRVPEHGEPVLQCVHGVRSQLRLYDQGVSKYFNVFQHLQAVTGRREGPRQFSIQSWLPRPSLQIQEMASFCVNNKRFTSLLYCFRHLSDNRLSQSLYLPMARLWPTSQLHNTQLMSSLHPERLESWRTLFLINLDD